MSHEVKHVPRHALRFRAAGAVRFETAPSNAAGAGVVPVRLVARSAQPVEHWYWGRLVHDMSGMRRHKDTLCLDYQHAEECGFLNKFTLDDQLNLIVEGAIVQTSLRDDVGRMIVERARGGVPYEASIDFGGEGIVIEEVAAGASVAVNGYQFQGPGAVVREWPLRGVAVCPYGNDMHTETALLSRDPAGGRLVKCRFSSAGAKPPARAIVPAVPAPTQLSSRTSATTPAAAATPAVPAKPKRFIDLVKIRGRRQLGSSRPASKPTRSPHAALAALVKRTPPTRRFNHQRMLQLTLQRGGPCRSPQ